MADLLNGCNDKHIPVSDFMDTFCRRCRNRECVHAGWAQDRFSVRVSTQEERFFNPNRADPRLPKYAQIVASEFQDMLRQAMALEIADQRGDWEIPEIPILDGRPDIATPRQTQDVDDAVKVLAAARGPSFPERAPPTPPVQAEPPPPLRAPEPQAPPPAPPVPPRGAPSLSQEKMSSVVMTLPRGNTDAPPPGGIMVDGSPVPVPDAAADEWAVPTKKQTKIAVGGKVILGGEPPEGA